MMVCFSKTKSNQAKTNTIICQLGDFEGVVVDARGHSGAIALLWDSFIDCSILSSSHNHIDSSVRWDKEDTVWNFIGIYGWFRLITSRK